MCEGETEQAVKETNGEREESDSGSLRDEKPLLYQQLTQSAEPEEWSDAGRKGGEVQKDGSVS